MTDHSLRIANFRLLDVRGEDVPFANIEGVRETDEHLAFYSSVAERPYYADVEIKIGSARGVQDRAVLIGALTAVATVVAVLLPESEALIEALAVLVVPTTFAAALLITREESSLARFVRRRTQWGIIAVTTALWVVTISRLVS